MDSARGRSSYRGITVGPRVEENGRISGDDSLFYQAEYPGEQNAAHFVRPG